MLLHLPLFVEATSNETFFSSLTGKHWGKQTRWNIGQDDGDVLGKGDRRITCRRGFSAKFRERSSKKINISLRQEKNVIGP